MSAFDKAWRILKEDWRSGMAACPACGGPADLINEGDLGDPEMMEMAEERGIPIDQLDSVVCRDRQGCGYDELAQPSQMTEGFDMDAWQQQTQSEVE
jgi:hypothetical protein